MPSVLHERVVLPLLNKLPSEPMHDMAREGLHFAEGVPFGLPLLELFADTHQRFSDSRLRVAIGGLVFENPTLVGAGWDKTGRSVAGLHALGFSGVEVGTVTVDAQPGNPKPRQFAVTPDVVINALGFPSPGAEAVKKNLQRYRGSGIPIGVSLGKNKVVEDNLVPEAHARVARILYDEATYFVINVSSPNTPGMRALQDTAPLTDIVHAVKDSMEVMGGAKPTFIKIAPDLTSEGVNKVIRVVSDNDLSGIIACNTTNNEEIKGKYGTHWGAQPGGLSGADPTYRRMTTEKVAHIYRETAGEMDIMGVGGIDSAETALEKIRAGAKLIQVVTAIRSVGTVLPGMINRGIIAFMEKEGIENLAEIVGIDSRN